MKMGLGRIALVQMGYSFRSRVGAVKSGGIGVIQMKNLTNQNLIDCHDLTRIEGTAIKDHHLVQPGDLIFRSRGHTTTSAILTEDPGPAVVAAPLFRIRVKHNIVLPEYLHWFINQPSAQAFLLSRAKGTALKMISNQSLEGLEVIVPPLPRQHLIAELAALVGEEQALMSRLADARKQYLTGRLMQMAIRT
jgi:hypothetical protein